MADRELTFVPADPDIAPFDVDERVAARWRHVGGHTLADYVSLVQRVVMATILLSLHTLGILDASTAPSWVLDAGIAIMVVVAVFGPIALIVLGPKPRRVLRMVLVPDLISTFLIVWATGTAADPMYPWVIGLALIYTIGLPFGESVVYSGVFAIVYLTAHLLGHAGMHPVQDYVFLVFKAAAVLVTAVFRCWRSRSRPRRSTVSIVTTVRSSRRDANVNSSCMCRPVTILGNRRRS